VIKVNLSFKFQNTKVTMHWKLMHHRWEIKLKMFMWGTLSDTLCLKKSYYNTFSEKSASGEPMKVQMT